MNKEMNNDVYNELTVMISNQFNKEVICDLTPQEHDLLFAVIGKIKRRGSQEVNISFRELKSLLRLKKDNPKELSRLSNSLWNKVKIVDYTLYAFGEPSGGVPLFSLWGIHEEKQILRVQINPVLQYFVNSFDKGNYSSLRYKDFQQTEDKYGKLLHRILAQWNSVGRISLSLEEIEHYLDVPKSYAGKPYILNEKVIKPAMIAVSPFFDDLELEKIRSGRKITHYLFTFTAKRVREKVNYNKKPKKTKTKTEEFLVVNDDEYEEMLEGLI